jgi:Na+/proline symporter
MDEFTRAVFEAVYNSRAQRSLRFFFSALLTLKHVLRGLLFSWPLYLLSAAGFALPGEYAGLLMLLIIPAVMVSGSILLLGLSEEYQERINGRLLKLQEWKYIVWGIEAS